MLFSRLVKITLILFIILGFFSKLHPIDDAFEIVPQTSSFGLNNSMIEPASEKLSTANVMQTHTCQIGHCGCFFNLPDLVNIVSVRINNSSYLLSAQLHYLSPDQKLIKRPPIS
ncbi:MAG: hypothetical protein WA160_08490 [Pseudobdellovibrio sp.]